MAFPFGPQTPKVCISLIIMILILGFYTTHFPLPQPILKALNPKTQTPDFHDTFLSLASNYTVSIYLRSLTLQPHLAGTPAASIIANYVKTHFLHLGLDTKVAEYSVLLSYPTHTSLTAHFSDVGVQDIGYWEPGMVGSEVVRPYHAYSPSGSGMGPAVFVNYGRERDYRALGEVGVNVSGCVVVVRRGAGMSRGGVVRVAAKEGAVAVLVYTEGEREYSRGVERGTVMKGLGDPLSPGWGSVTDADGGERLGRGDSAVVERFPEIPSLPISVETAELVLSSLEGPQVPQEWRDKLLSLKVGRVGPGPTLLNLTYKGVEKMATIRDIFAVIRGTEEPDRYVLLGNHRDAWTYGAVDPNSGTSALLDVARRYALLMRLGWSPRRTIILCSWDAEEFGMIGSTEWVEQNIMNLASKAVAYLNVDCAVQGPGLFASMTPQLDDVFVDITKKVMDPDVEGTTIYEQWTARNEGLSIQRLSGVDSDFAPFLQHAGVSSVDIYFGKDIPVYHTAYDSYDWMVNHGDPFFHRHTAVAGLWGLLALRLADDPILPFNYVAYAMQLQEYTGILSGVLAGRASVLPIITSIQRLLAAAKQIEDEVKGPKANGRLGEPEGMRKRMLNDRLMLVERGLVDAEGLLGNRWFKHLVYGPSMDSESKLSFFPSITNAIYLSRDSNATIQHEIWRVARAIQRAADALRGDIIS